jgi:hypothetical protein
MQYEHINDYTKVPALQERLYQLEQAHYSASVFLIEAEAVGDQKAIAQFRAEMDGIDVQYNAVKTEHDTLVADLERENPTEDEDSNAGELRGESSS